MIPRDRTLSWNTFLLCCKTIIYLILIITLEQLRIKHLSLILNHKIIVNNSKLPEYIKNQLKSYLDHTSYQVLSSHRWSLSFQFDGLSPLLSLFHSDLLFHQTYHMYQFHLTAFGNSAFKYSPSIIYSKVEKSLFISNASSKYSAYIHKLDLKNKSEWEHIGNLSTTPYNLIISVQCVWLIMIDLLHV